MSNSLLISELLFFFLFSFLNRKEALSFSPFSFLFFFRKWSFSPILKSEFANFPTIHCVSKNFNTGWKHSFSKSQAMLVLHMFQLLVKIQIHFYSYIAKNIQQNFAFSVENVNYTHAGYVYITYTSVKWNFTNVLFPIFYAIKYNPWNLEQVEAIFGPEHSKRLKLNN